MLLDKSTAGLAEGKPEIARILECMETLILFVFVVMGRSVRRRVCTGSEHRHYWAVSSFYPAID